MKELLLIRPFELGGTTAQTKLNNTRIVAVKCNPKYRPSRTGGRGGPKQGQLLLIATDRFDLAPETIAAIYQHRWTIEIYFRFFKHILGCRHLISHNKNGIEIQMYMAIIACMLIKLVDRQKTYAANVRDDLLVFYGNGRSGRTARSHRPPSSAKISPKGPVRQKPTPTFMLRKNTLPVNPIMIKLHPTWQCYIIFSKSKHWARTGLTPVPFVAPGIG